MPTQTSMLVNETEIRKPHVYRLVDVPGHPRIRAQFSEYLNMAKAIVFVVDSSTISRNGPAIAEWVSLWCFFLTPQSAH
jgi:signal recognition particle receptor subunit beta